MLKEESGFRIADGHLACRFDQVAFDDAVKHAKAARSRKESEIAATWLLIAEAISYLSASGEA